MQSKLSLTKHITAMKYKKQILKIFLLLLLPAFTVAQNFIHFPDSGGLWKETYWWQPSPVFYNGIGDTYIEGDTVINDTVYHKVYNLRRDVFCSDSIISEPEYDGALREDTINQKVYYRGIINASDQLLYDYSLEIGDTLQTNMYTPYYGVYVTAIDTITTFDGVQRRIWYLDSEEPFDGWPQIIEGIGSTSGLHGGTEPYWEGWNELLCFSVNGDEVWRSFRDTCYVVTDTCVPVGINETVYSKTSIKYYPNPVSTSTTVSFEFNQIRTTDNYLWIFDLFGKEIAHTKFLYNSFTIRSPANKGLYMVKIFVNNNYYTFKLIVSN